MASTYADYSKPYRTIREGSVKIIYENYLQINKTRYIKALCGCSEDWPARLRIYRDDKSATEEISVLQEILFTDVESVHCTKMWQKEIVTIVLEKDNKTLSFYADSCSSTKKWYRFCGLLFKIPKYTIPEIPKENIALQQGIERYSDSHKHSAANEWVVNVLSEGIGGIIKVIGLSVVSIRNTCSTFNIIDFYTGKQLLTWHRNGIRLSGCIESLVFVEARGTCRGGPGLLWMQHPMPQSVSLQKHMHDFLFPCGDERKTTSPVAYVFIDSVTSTSYIKDDSEQQLSQTPYDQSSDISSSGNTPVSQSASLSSESSQYSSGYHSDSSYSESVTPKSSKLPHPKVAYKYFHGQEKVKSHGSFTVNSRVIPPVLSSSVASSSANQSITPTNHKSNNLSGNGFKSGSVPRKPTSLHGSCKSSTHLSLQNQSLPPQSHSAKMSRIPKPSHSGATASYCTSSDCHSTSKVHPSALQDSALQICNLSLKHKPTTSKGSTSTTIATKSKHQLENIIIQRCSVEIVESLDVLEIFPHLNSQGLLTGDDRQILQNTCTTNKDKARYLLDALPRKEEGFLNKFLHCLYQTTSGTGHRNIAKALSTSYKEVMEGNYQVTTPIGHPA